MSNRHKSDDQQQQKRDPNATQRVQQAIMLRTLGYNYDDIAAKCGYGNRGTAYRAIQRELARSIAENVEDMRAEESAHLNALQKTFMPKALKGDQWACDRVLRIMERRAKLFALDQTPDAALQANMVLIRQVACDTEAL